jgi:hypothetical protein
MGKSNHHDPFEGLRNNWMFVTALAAVAFWLTQNIFDIKTVNTTQTGDITENKARIEKLEESIEDNRQTSSEIIRRLDAVQKDIEVIKTQK